MRKLSPTARWLARASLVVLALALGAVLLGRLVPRQTHPWILPPGTQAAHVMSSGPETLGRINGGTREVAHIKLASGAESNALVLSGGPLFAGDTVAVRERITTLPSNFHYEVVARRDRKP